MWCQNIGSMFYSFVTKHAWDRRTDGQNYDPLDRASLAASHGKNGVYAILGDISINEWLLLGFLLLMCYCFHCDYATGLVDIYE